MAPASSFRVPDHEHRLQTPWTLYWLNKQYLAPNCLAKLDSKEETYFGYLEYSFFNTIKRNLKNKLKSNFFNLKKKFNNLDAIFIQIFLILVKKLFTIVNICLIFFLQNNMMKFSRVFFNDRKNVKI